ncbi:hypothetical protein BGZ60DRAFT_80677 [Tricladium varicosporioides]|nr:hypothetical protein BGZ60DRAFT_80677 [Hymenoscyphus varicosporioides]
MSFFNSLNSFSISRFRIAASSFNLVTSSRVLICSSVTWIFEDSEAFVVVLITASCWFFWTNCPLVCSTSISCICVVKSELRSTDCLRIAVIISRVFASSFSNPSTFAVAAKLTRPLSNVRCESLMTFKYEPQFNQKAQIKLCSTVIQSL